MTMKKIYKFILLLIVIFLVVKVFVYILTKPYYKDFNNYEILVKSPIIEITESKITRNKGYMNGVARNNTGSLINNLNLKFDFYDINEKRIGTEYEQIDIFNVKEEVKFEMKFEYKNVEKVRISVINNTEE